MTVEINQDALLLAAPAFIETEGSNAKKVEAAIWAYLWALENQSDWFGMITFPSLNELREALANR